MRLTLALLLITGATACTTPTLDTNKDPAILSALDREADGFVGFAPDGTRFRIQSTSVSQDRLCRVVSLDVAGRFKVESYCKAPGGTWR